MVNYRGSPRGRTSKGLAHDHSFGGSASPVGSILLDSHPSMRGAHAFVIRSESGQDRICLASTEYLSVLVVACVRPSARKVVARLYSRILLISVLTGGLCDKPLAVWAIADIPGLLRRALLSLLLVPCVA